MVIYRFSFYKIYVPIMEREVQYPHGDNIILFYDHHYSLINYISSVPQYNNIVFYYIKYPHCMTI